MKRILFLLGFLWLAVPAGAQVYPTCPTSSGPLAGQTVNCTVSALVTSSATPLFAAMSARQYLYIQNQGYVNTTLNNYPVCCTIGSSNNPVWTGSLSCNGVVIQPGGTYEPIQMVLAQTAFRVPPGDISCIAPFGNVQIIGVQE
jgi:hypothetical protein